MSDLGYGHDDISCMTFDIHDDISCMTFYIHVDILLGCADICDGPLHVHFRLGVAHVGKYNYWTSLTPSWDPPFRYREYLGRRRSLEAAFEKKADMWL